MNTENNFLDNYQVEEFDTDSEFELIESPSLFGDDNNNDNNDNNNLNSSNELYNELLNELLKEQGIIDPSQIKFENENGEEEKINFYDLSKEEQLDILKNNQSQDNELDDSEISFINYLRQNELTPDEFLNAVRQNAIDDYILNNKPLESIDSMSDDEIFLSDLLIKIPNLTDEEAEEALNLEKLNSVLYAKKVESLRNDLLQKEQLKKQLDDIIKEEEKNQSIENFKSSLYLTAPSIKDIANRIELDQSDIAETIDFLVSEDVTGIRYIAKALNDPESLIKMAWFYIKGEEAINQMAEYYESQIKDYAKNSYEKGYQDAKNGVVPTKRVTTKSKDNKTNIPQFTNIPQNPALIKK